MNAVFIFKNMNYLIFEYGKGCYLYSDKGEKFFDAISGIGVCGLGHANSQTKVISSQSKSFCMFQIYLISRIKNFKFQSKHFFVTQDQKQTK